MDYDIHRTYGKTHDCKGCRYWSEMIAMQRGADGVEALCLAPGADAPLAGRYVSAGQTCTAWASGHLGPVDEPGNDHPRKYQGKTPAVSVELASSGPYGYVKRGGPLLKVGDMVRLLDRAVVCTVVEASPPVLYEGAVYRVWNAQGPHGWRVSIMEIDTPMH